MISTDVALNDVKGGVRERRVRRASVAAKAAHPKVAEIVFCSVKSSRKAKCLKHHMKGKQAQ